MNHYLSLSLSIYIHICRKIDEPIKKPMAHKFTLLALVCTRRYTDRNAIAVAVAVAVISAPISLDARLQHVASDNKGNSSTIYVLTS